MITMSTYIIYQYLCKKFPELKPHLRNGAIDKSAEKSIGVFLASSTRSSGKLAIGGLNCTTVRMLPVNIHVKWGSNQREHDLQAIEIYNALLAEESNFMVEDAKIACVEVLDECPMALGRDDKNICESVIRANFHYYV